MVELIMHVHSIIHRNGSKRYRAVCSCGWRSEETCESEREARRHAAAHCLDGQYSANLDTPA
jgi:hypothetical protein